MACRALSGVLWGHEPRKAGLGRTMRPLPPTARRRKLHRSSQCGLNIPGNIQVGAPDLSLFGKTRPQVGGPCHGAFYERRRCPRQGRLSCMREGVEAVCPTWLQRAAGRASERGRSRNGLQRRVVWPPQGSGATRFQPRFALDPSPAQAQSHCLPDGGPKRGRNCNVLPRRAAPNAA